MGNYGYLSAKPHAVTRVDNTDYLKASASRRTTYNAFAKAARLGSTTYGFSPYYYNKDHLGNIREVVNMGGTVQQVTNYYPFGAPYADPNAVMGATVQPYKYIFSIEREKRKLACSSEREKKRQKVNGKELDRMHGLDTYDYGARQYDPVLARWDRVDPLCEKYYGVSPYAYCGDDPVNILDFHGDSIIAVSKISGLRLLNEIHNTFYGEQFEKLNSLFQLSDDGRTLRGIKRSEFSTAIKNLNPDEKALAIGYYKAINSKDVHYVDMTLREESLNPMTIDHFRDFNFRTGRQIDHDTNGGVNTDSGRNGSFSIVIMNSIENVDFVYSSNENHYNRKSTPAEILAHELLGHGFSSSIGSPGSKYIDAIQLTNLYWRVRGYHLFYRDGTNHGWKMTKSKATSIPYFLLTY